MTKDEQTQADAALALEEVIRERIISTVAKALCPLGGLHVSSTGDAIVFALLSNPIFQGRMQAMIRSEVEKALDNMQNTWWAANTNPYTLR